MSEIIDNLTGYLNELDNYMNRLNAGRLSRKDRKLFLDMSNEYYEIFRQYYEADHNAFPEELFRAMENFNDNIANQNKDAVVLANDYYKNIADIAGRFRDTAERIELLFGVFQKDAAELNLHDEKIAMLQDLVDLDQRMQGKISQETLQVLEVQHCEVVDGKVIEVQESQTYTETPAIPDTDPQEKTQQQIEESSREHEDKNHDQNKTQEREKEDMEERKSNVTTINGKEYRVFTATQLDQMLTEQAQTPKRQRKILDLSDCYIENYVFKGDMDYVSFDGSNFKNCEFKMTKSNHTSFKNAVFADCDLRHSDFKNCSFDTANLIGTVFDYNMFIECAFDNALIKKTPISASNFYKVSFSNTTLDDANVSNIEPNTFIECKTDSVIYRQGGATRDELERYTESVKDAFNNNGYSYKVEFTEWNQPDRLEKDLENGETQYTVKIFDGESKLSDDFVCTARFNPETFDILDVDSAKAFDQKTTAMFAEQVSDGLWFENGIKETEYLRNSFEVLGVNEFLEPKVIVTYSAAPEFKRNQIYTLTEFNAKLADLNKEITGASSERIDFVVGIAEKGMDKPEFLYNQTYMAGHEDTDWCTKFVKGFDAQTSVEKRQLNLVTNFMQSNNRINLKLPRMERKAFLELTKQLKENGARYDSGKTQWYILPDNENMEFFNKFIPGKSNRDKSDPGTEFTPEQFKLDGKSTYRAYAYMRGNDQKPQPVYGKSPEQIVEKLQTWNKSRTDEMKLQTCYVQKLNPDTNKFESIGKWDLSTGKDITPIYLTIPHMDDRNEFKQLVSTLKANGAKYNSIKKAFYITRQDDLNKFAPYLPLTGTPNETRDNGSKTERNFTIEPGQEYYDNRVKVTIEGMKPIQIYGDDYDVHFPSMSADETRDIIEKYVLPELSGRFQEKELPAKLEYNGQIYDSMQYNVLKLAEQQHFTKEQMSLLEHPELSSDRMNEVRFAVRDGLSAEQIAQFASPSYEQWQMDLCRIGLQHGFSMKELQPVINPEGYTPDRWGERRNQLQKMVHERSGRGSLMSKLNNNKSKVASAQHENVSAERGEKKKSLPGNVIE